MVNPARELANLIVDSSVQAGKAQRSIYDSRGSNGAAAMSVGFWRRHGEAFGYLVDLERRMDELERAGHSDIAASRGVLPACYRAIVVPDQAWTQANPELLNGQQMSSLRLLATLIDVTEGRSGMTSPKRQALLSCVGDAIAALGDTADLLDENERRYILNLLNSIQTLLNEKDVLGGVDLSSLVDQLSGALLGAG